MSFLKINIGHCDLYFMVHFFLIFQDHLTYIQHSLGVVKVKRMQKSGTEAIRTQTQPSKTKREITNITNSQNTKRTHGQPSEQLFPKRWPCDNAHDCQRSAGYCDLYLMVQ